jgi:ribosomal protein S18 acetylase RimI-like enzyme
MKIHIESTDKPTNEEIEHISESLFQYNCKASGINDFRPFATYLKNENNEILGGVIGWTRWSWAHIENLWISENYRKLGYGKKLLDEAERIARERKCKMIDLDTFNFQAPEFYKKYGYEELFVLNGIDLGVTKHFFQKKLDN